MCVHLGVCVRGAHVGSGGRAALFPQNEGRERPGACVLSLLPPPLKGGGIKDASDVLPCCRRVAPGCRAFIEITSFSVARAVGFMITWEAGSYPGKWDRRQDTAEPTGVGAHSREGHIARGLTWRLQNPPALRGIHWEGRGLGRPAIQDPEPSDESAGSMTREDPGKRREGGRIGS